MKQPYSNPSTMILTKKYVQMFQSVLTK